MNVATKCRISGHVTPGKTGRYVILTQSLPLLADLICQRWADSGTVNAGERRNDSPISTNATYLLRSIQTSRNESIFIACSGGAGSVRGT